MYLFGHLDTKVRPFAPLKDFIEVERGFLRICDSSMKLPDDDGTMVRV
jgi:hypothetical protein